ncbi:hypothetical protein QTP88_017839 [Uroleucon formosanum]
MAIHVAVNKVWPSTRLRDCRFHLGQAWFRQIQSLGLVNEYKNKNSEIGKYLKTFFGLSFLNPPDVNDCFTDDLISILSQDYRVERFTDYILENYISKSSKYPKEMLIGHANRVKFRVSGQFIIMPRAPRAPIGRRTANATPMYNRRQQDNTPKCSQTLAQEERNALRPMTILCPKCHAKKWKDETHGLCCTDGKVVLHQFEDL